jgi:large subunit ribosomal protein L31e
MAKQKTVEPKVILEREYIVPLRKGWLKVPKHKRGNKAIKTLKEFIARHMKLRVDDLRRVRIDMLLNNEIRFRGMKKPPAKLKVRAKKFDDNIIRVELVTLPAHVKYKQLRETKKKEEITKKVEKKQEQRKKLEEQAKKDEEEKPEEEDKEKKEKEEASKEESLKLAEQQAKQQKHTTKEKQVQVHRKALSR